MIISHIDAAERRQSNEAHQAGVARRAEAFAAVFGMGAWGRALGLLHDKGKERDTFQAYIRGEAGCGEHTHAWIGAKLAGELYGPSLANAILGHHAGLYDADEIASQTARPLPAGVTPEAERVPLTPPPFRPVAKDMHHIVRLLFSCLVDADRLDTEAFMQPDAAQLRGRGDSLEALLPVLEAHLAALQAKSPATAVNALRREVQDCCRRKADGAQGFYTLTVPTGGGKTLASLLWALRHAVRHGLRRIVVAIPFTSIVTQTAATLRQIFGPDNVLEHHSGVTLSDADDLATENWDAPIVVTTNVQLLESMFASRPTPCRKLHNIAASVVILDETQTLPTAFLQPIIDALDTYQRLLRVSFLFTTASQPVVSGRIECSDPKQNFHGLPHVEEIIPAALRLHERLRRVALHFDPQAHTYDEVAAALAGHRRVLCIVSTRRDARELFARLPREGHTLHISRMMSPEHVDRAIAEVKRLLTSDDGEPLRVVTTQLIEAGVDIDFPVVYRQEAGLDSVLQAAGRCNREGLLDEGHCHVFSLDGEHTLPTGELSRANEARKSLPADADPQAPDTMTRYFQQFYRRHDAFDRRHIADLLYKPREAQFRTAAEAFRLIEDDGQAVIVNDGPEAETLIKRLATAEIDLTLMRRLARHTVKLRRRDFDLLLKAGLIEEVRTGLYVVSDASQYDPQTGLRTDNHWQQEILII